MEDNHGVSLAAHEACPSLEAWEPLVNVWQADGVHMVWRKGGEMVSSRAEFTERSGPPSIVTVFRLFYSFTHPIHFYPQEEGAAHVW